MAWWEEDPFSPAAKRKHTASWYKWSNQVCRTKGPYYVILSWLSRGTNNNWLSITKTTHFQQNNGHFGVNRAIILFLTTPKWLSTTVWVLIFWRSFRLWIIKARKKSFLANLIIIKNSFKTQVGFYGHIPYSKNISMKGIKNFTYAVGLMSL